MSIAQSQDQPQLIAVIITPLTAEQTSRGAVVLCCGREGLVRKQGATAGVNSNSNCTTVIDINSCYTTTAFEQAMVQPLQPIPCRLYRRYSLVSSHCSYFYPVTKLLKIALHAVLTRHNCRLNYKLTYTRALGPRPTSLLSHYVLSAPPSLRLRATRSLQVSGCTTDAGRLAAVACANATRKPRPVWPTNTVPMATDHKRR